MTTSTLDRQVEHRLSDQEIRYTKGRRKVVAALAGSDGPRSAAEIHQEIREQVPLSSLYRSLAVLQEAGVVSPHYSTGGIARFELAEWLTGHHHHLVCLRCGSVEDIELGPQLEKDLGEIVKRIGARSKFNPTDHALEVEGVCAACT